LDSEIFDNNWIIYRKDRNYELSGTTRGGGVLIAIHRSLASQPLDLIIDNTSEQIWAKLIFDNRTIFLCACYLPPLSDSNCYDNISQSVTAVSKILNENDDIIIFGDFNLPHLDFIPDEDDPKIYWPCNIRNNTDEVITFTRYLMSKTLEKFNLT
jgi:hypothetical protein